MENSPFNKLSAEVRNKIWQYAVTSGSETVPLDCYETPAISRVCKQIRDETRLMFYASNEFHVTIHSKEESPPLTSNGGNGGEDPALRKTIEWLDRLDHETHGAVKSIKISVMSTTRSDSRGYLDEFHKWMDLGERLRKYGYVKPRLQVEVERYMYLMREVPLALRVAVEKV